MSRYWLLAPTHVWRVRLGVDCAAYAHSPLSGVVTFHFSPASGAAEANTRIRLAASQNVIAIAKMNDGSFYMTSKPVKVTISGCGG